MTSNSSSRKQRCPWVGLDRPEYVDYHDREWGVPLHEDQRIFEFLTLESAQAGLSWLTVLRKRENYRRAFDGFDPVRIARYGEADEARLLADAGIIRNRSKIRAAISNARCFLDIQEEFGSFDTYVWRFVDGKPIVHEIRTPEDYPASSPESEALSRDLRQRGFKFMGPIIVYAHMQAAGMVNDHASDCFRREEIISGYQQQT